MSRPRLLALAYLVSGAAGLVYQVVWMRVLALHAGHTAAAVSTVLAAFMGGLALGAALAARVPERWTPRAALRAYAGCEALIAAFALALPGLMDLLTPLLAAAYADGTGGARFALVRLAVTLAVLAPPTVAMGATFPLAVRAAGATADGSPRPDAGALYAVNTLGAAAGAALAGFFLVPRLGLRGSVWVAVTLNLAAAGAALWLARAPATLEEPRPGLRASRARPAGAARPPSTMPLPAVAGLLAVSGAAALAYEVVWTRLLALSIGPTTQAFGLMLAVFITGLGLGAALGTRLAHRVRVPGFWLGLSQVAAALCALTAFRGLEATTLRVARLVAAVPSGFDALLVSEAFAVGALLLPMTVVLGLAFPLGLAAAGTESGARAGRMAGVIYAVNTVGAIAGSLAAGFLLMPWLGTRATLLAAAALATLAGSTVALAAAPSARWRLAASLAGAAALAGGWLAPTLNQPLISAGGYKYAGALGGSDLATLLEAGSLLYYGDGAGATVTVRRLTGTTSLAIDGKVDASNGGDMLTQKLLAHLPLLLHHAPRTAAIIGLGSGVTLGAALTHPLARVDTLEISPEVVEASAFFKAENLRALDDPRSRVIAGDGRTHLLLSRERYDVIVSEPSNPWMAGVASLFTREFFEAARARLAPGGLLCQWAHTYDISAADLRSIVATFGSVFPHGSMWLVGEADLLLVGGDADVATLLPNVDRGWTRPGVKDDLARVGLTRPFALATLLVGTSPAVRAFAADGAIQTDDHTPLEFSAPRALYGARDAGVVGTLLDLAARTGAPAWASGHLASATAADWLATGAMLLRADAHARAFEAYARVFAVDPNDYGAVGGLLDAAARAGRTDDARARLERQARQGPQWAAARVGLSRVAAATGTFDAAAELAREAVAAAPGEPRTWEQLASVAADAGNVAALGEVVGELSRRFPARPLTAYFQGSLAFLQGDLEAAAARALDATRGDGALARAHNLLGAARASQGRPAEARAAFQRALEADPTDATTYVNLARLESTQGDFERARGLLAEALVVAPDADEARAGLAAVLDRLGQPERARALRTPRASF